MNRRIELLLFSGGIWWWVRHSIFWMVMYLDEVLYTFLETDGMEDLDLFFIPFVLDVITVYVNLYWLIPRLLNENKYISYLMASILTVFTNVSLILLYIYLPEEGSPHWDEFVSSFIATITLLATAIAIKVGKYSFEQQKTTEKLQFEQSKLELNYLKKQINPHFLFNVLNTIHIQSISEPGSVSETVHQLSDLLRYQIYEAGSSETVLLSKEIDFLENYVSLEKIRRSNLTVNWSEFDAIPKIKITPFLFLPLIENALKHSRSINEDPSEIDISWMHKNGVLKLDVANSLGDAKDEESGGFGIDNLKKRLEFLYPGRYNFIMSIENGKFVSSLQLTINESHNY